ncbi:SdpI family protein [Streptomyces radicis]|uniref:SdpI family protein n=1 Tax=Streptomyces radicis TaxID=1750517 RepID=A0A3A9WGM8_9ACTN|nr:SdpI family protein [Streptomyces radicis]RKN11970.1 SdpI family protein [Streptomyces radicis]RKN25978.1 SdpI family protein [Streptomyces radicis]
MTDAVTTGTAITTALALTVAGVLLLALGLLPQRGKLSRNAFLGIRTVRALESDETWRTMHRVAGPWVTAGGVLLLLVAFSGFYLDSEPAFTVTVLTATGACVALLFTGAWRGSRALRPRPVEAATGGGRGPGAGVGPRPGGGVSGAGRG